MRFLTISLIVSLCVQYSLAANCNLIGYEGLSTININNPIDDDAEIFLTIDTENVIKAEIKDPNTNQYIDVDYSNNKLTFKPSDKYRESFEKENNMILPRVTTDIRLTCEDSTTYDITYLQSLKDKNTFEPVFEKSTYEFEIPMPIGGKIELTNFGEDFYVTDYDMTNNQIDFKIEGDNSELFEVIWVVVPDSKNKKHQGILKTKVPFRLNKEITFDITATDVGEPKRSSTAKVIIKVDESGSLPSSPYFESGYYDVNYNIDNDKHSIDKIFIPVSEGVTTENLNLEGANAGNFEYTVGTDGLEISLKSNLPENIINGKSFIGLSITASIENAEVSAKTSLIITMPDKANFAFEKILYEAVYSETDGIPKITPVTIEVNNEATVILDGDYKEYFKYDDTTKSIEAFKLLPQDIINTKSYIDVTIRATLGSSEAKAVLIVSLNSECTTPPSAEITFTSDLIFKREPSEDIDLFVTAKSTINEEIEYNLNGDVPSQIKLYSNGRLQTVNLPSGFYELELVATGTTSKATKSTSLIILIGSAEICNDGTITNRYSFRSFVVYEENAEEFIILPKGDGYSYKIKDIQPNKDKFDLNANGDFVAKTLDRESNEFGTGKAQYLAKIELIPDTKTNMYFSLENSETKILTFKQETFAGDDSCFALDTIENESNHITVGIIVGDVNDHKPTFGDSNKIIVGYPESDLLTIVSPAYIIKVEATDEDIGEYASLEYKTTNSEVIIDSKNGYIYPTNKIYDNDVITVKIIATDEDGNGLSSDELTVVIKILEQEHLCILRYQNKHLEDLDEIMQSLAQYADVRYLSASVLPGSNPYTRDSNDRSLIIVAYGFDNKENLLTAEELIEILGDVDGLSINPLPNPCDDSGSTENPTECPDGGSSTTENPDDNDDDDNECSNGGLIAAIVILAILLALCLGGFIAFYFFKFRKTKSYNQMEEEGLPKHEQIENESEQPKFTKHRVPIPNTKSEIDLNGRRPTGYLYPADFAEGHSNQGFDQDEVPSSAPPLDTDETKERRKSVVFNANVEEINIEREPEEEKEKDKNDITNSIEDTLNDK